MNEKSRVIKIANNNPWTVLSDLQYGPIRNILSLLCSQVQDGTFELTSCCKKLSQTYILSVRWANECTRSFISVYALSSETQTIIRLQFITADT